MISFKHKGDFSKFSRYLTEVKNRTRAEAILNKCGAEGVAALASATPVESGTTAGSWYYKITQTAGSSSVEFHNSHVNKGVRIAIILQYGHGTGTGGWVEGRDYINPAIQPIFDRIVENTWREVTSL